MAEQTRFQKLIALAEAIGELEASSPAFFVMFDRIQRQAARALKIPETEPRNTNLRHAHKMAAAANKRRGDETAKRVKPLIAKLRREGYVTFEALAKALNKQKVTPPRSKSWNATSVRNIELR